MCLALIKEEMKTFSSLLLEEFSVLSVVKTTNMQKTPLSFKKRVSFSDVLALHEARMYFPWGRLTKTLVSGSERVIILMSEKTLFLVIKRHVFIWVALTKIAQTEWLKQQTFTSLRSGDPESEGMPAHLGPEWGLSSRFTDGHLLAMSSRGGQRSSPSSLFL